MEKKCGRRRKYDPKVLLDIYATGVSASAVGKMLGIHHTTVLDALKSAGVALRKRPLGSLTAREVMAAKVEENRMARAARNQEMCRLYVEDGHSILSIARTYGLHHSAVLSVLRKGGVQMRSPGHRSPMSALAPRKTATVDQETRDKMRRARLAYYERIHEERDRRLERMMVLVSRIASRRARICA